ncbi:hypothetical protein E2C01_004428 [Portunus trituberculatus]|uniref:Uncharacterized protein n=1 Tax=Portunus trituberculatus TaxID=210409 RepID=A0A5B7CWC4_PORTR|nr:hypothetical protein [Portunus trituberculatus]
MWLAANNTDAITRQVGHASAATRGGTPLHTAQGYTRHHGNEGLSRHDYVAALWCCGVSILLEAATTFLQYYLKKHLETPASHLGGLENSREPAWPAYLPRLTCPYYAGDLGQWRQVRASGVAKHYPPQVTTFGA